MLSANRKTMQGKRMGNVYNSRETALLNRIVMRNLIEQVNFAQIFEGGEDVTWEKVFLAE